MESGILICQTAKHVARERGSNSPAMPQEAPVLCRGLRNREFTHRKPRSLPPFGRVPELSVSTERQKARSNGAPVLSCSLRAIEPRFRALPPGDASLPALLAPDSSLLFRRPRGQAVAEGRLSTCGRRRPRCRGLRRWSSRSASCSSWPARGGSGRLPCRTASGWRPGRRRGPRRFPPAWRCPGGG